MLHRIPGVFTRYGSAASKAIGFFLQKTNNLSDLTSASTARTNLGLAAVAASGSATDLGSGTLSTARLPALTGGDVTSSAGSGALTIGNNTVTYAKMQDVSATSRIIGRKTASAGDPEECTLSEILDFIGSAAQGDILYRGASAWARLPAGTSGDFLKTNGAGANPSWATGSFTAATQAEQETGTSTTVGVTPGRQHFHPSAVKAWGNANISGSLLGGYGISSVTDGGTGNVTFNLGVTLSSTNNMGIAPGMFESSAALTFRINGFSTTSVNLLSYTVDSPANADPDGWFVQITGDL